MVRKTWMWEMTPNSALEGMVMVSGEAITPSEVEDCLKDTLDRPMGQTTHLIIVYLVPGHPPMCSDVGFIELVRHVIVFFPANPILDLTMVFCCPMFTFESSIRHYQRTSRGGQGTMPRLRRRRQERTRRWRGGERGR
jgi:hypothetical protein